MSEAVSYSNYLRLDELLNIQTLKSDREHGSEHDELLFIVIHQVYELWFKVLLRDFEYLQEHLQQNETARATHTTRRILSILKTIVAQVDVLETMTPLEFNAFRSFLGNASGFQSLQFREIEFLLGQKRAVFLDETPEELSGRERLVARYNQPTVWDAFLRYLSLNGYAIPIELLERDVTEPVRSSAEIQVVLADIYRNNSALSNICERLLDIDEGLQEWRYRHVKMVERMIGSKIGTGGTTGVRYLSTTIKPSFPDLWAVRSNL